MLVLGIGIAYNYLSNIHGARSSLLGYKTNNFLNLHVALEYNQRRDFSKLKIIKIIVLYDFEMHLHISRIISYNPKNTILNTSNLLKRLISVLNLATNCFWWMALAITLS